MSRGYNKVILMGNLARDPDVRHTPSKQKVARFTIAVGRQWKNRATGETQNQTDFIPVVAWAFLADICDRYLRKGKPVLVEGRIQVRDYDDPKTGARRWVTEVIAENMTMLSSGRRDDDSYGDIPVPRPPQSSDRPKQAKSEDAPFDDVGSLRDEAGFEEDFPLDFSEMGDMNGETGEVDVPF